MSLRGTLLFFCGFLSILWVFNLMLALKRTAYDETFILPSLKASDAKIDYIHIRRRGDDKKGEEFTFVQKDQQWFLKWSDDRLIRVENFKVDQLIRDLTNASRNEDAGIKYNPADYGLSPPSTSVTLKGKGKLQKAEKEWKFNLGHQAPTKTDYWVTSSDRPDQVVAVRRTKIDSLLFQDIDSFRPTRLLDASEGGTQRIELHGQDQDVIFQKKNDGTWWYEKPGLGLADFEGPPSDKKEPFKKEGGLKGLLGQLSSLRVEESDFVPLQETDLAAFGLADGKERYRIVIGNAADTFVDPKKDKEEKKDLKQEVLLVGNTVRDMVYVRRANDPGMARISRKQLQPILDVLQSPGELRSRDLAHFDPQKVSRIVLKSPDQEPIEFKKTDKDWQVSQGKGITGKASEPAVQKLLDTLQGKREIYGFQEASTELKNPAVEVLLYEQGDKEGPILTLSFGKTMNDLTSVLRTSRDGLVSRFTIPGGISEKLMPITGALAYLDLNLPEIEPIHVTGVSLVRGSDKLSLKRATGKTINRWTIDDGSAEPAQADPNKMAEVLDRVTLTRPLRFAHKTKPGEDLSAFGLDKPSMEITLTVKKDQLPPGTAASVLGLLGSDALVGSAGSLALLQQAGKEQKVTLRIGQVDSQGPTGGVFAQRSDTDLIFLLPGNIVQAVREADLRDRTYVLNTQPRLNAGTIALGFDPLNFLGNCPFLAPMVQSFPADQVRELRLEIRTPVELRKFRFVKEGKDWKDQSGLLEFQLDQQKIQALVEQLSHFPAERIVQLVGGPKPEQGFGSRESPLMMEAVLQSGQAIRMTIGQKFQDLGYFAQSTAWPGGVLLVAPSRLEPLLQGPAYFARERLVVGP